MAEHVCVDCRALPEGERPPNPRKTQGGPRSQRCRPHRQARRVHVKAQAHARYVGNTYGLPEGFYDALYEAQGGRCAWCGLSDGGAKKLAVDHDHTCCSGSTSCGKCVRGLLDSVCNQFLGFRMRDDPETVRRGARYLSEPPAQALYLSWGGETA